MATKAKTLQVKDKEKDDKAADAPEKDSADAPSPLLDLSDAAVKKMIKQAKKRGFVTFDQLNEVLPSDTTSPEQIEDIMSMLSDMGINVTEADDSEGEDEKDDGDDETDNELVEVTQKAVTEVKKSEPGERTDDPVRMYLREMGTVELLSREGEIAIAKRIEAGREAMIAGLCESPLTFQAIIIWRDELNEGKIFLRDIIDLEATYAGPESKGGINPNLIGNNGAEGAAAEGNGGDAQAGAPAHVAPPAAPPSPTPFRAAPAGGEAGAEEKDPAEAAAEGDMDDDEFENQMSLAAIEAELASIQATLDGMLADAEQWDARAAERAATIRPAVNAAMDAAEDTVRRPRVWPVALVVPLVLLVAVPLVLVLSGCQDSGARPTPAPGPAVTAPTWQAHIAALGQTTTPDVLANTLFESRVAWYQP